MLGGSLGGVTGALFLNFFPISSCFYALLAMSIFGILYVPVRIRETVVIVEANSSIGAQLRALFSLTNLRDVAQVMTKRRTGFDRRRIWLLLCAFFFYQWVTAGESVVDRFLFTVWEEQPRK